jgi:hypothetical protein
MLHRETIAVYGANYVKDINTLRGKSVTARGVYSHNYTLEIYLFLLITQFEPALRI